MKGRALKSYEQVKILLQKTKSSELRWMNGGNDLYIAVLSNVEMRLFHFQTEVRGHSRIVLDIVEGYTKNRIIEPEPHISTVPIGKMWYFAASLWNMLFSKIVPVRTPPLQPETQEEKESEQLRIGLHELQKAVIGETGE
ncbi:MAG: hypothetical protein HYT93_00230 [Parcubacteria group bacterium]|nr:hypothetical protein [Parcubacteria group bacterium]